MLGERFYIDNLAGVAAASPAPTPPAITANPQPVGAVVGGTAVFSVTATGGALRYQWNKDGAPISGATHATLVLTDISSTDFGSYSVAVTNPDGSLISAAARLTLVPATEAGRIVNLSIRSRAGTGAQTLIVGLTLGGAGTSGQTPVLMRGIGPALGAFGVPGALADPTLTIYSSGSVLASNDNWSGDAQVSAASTAVGAFPLGAATGRDAAIFASVPAGSYSVQIAGNDGGGGVSLAEIYDATPTGTVTAARPRLTNVSARTQVDTGSDILIAGMVISGATPKTVLIRGIGPTLTTFGVAGALADPKLELYAGNTKLGENDNWNGDAALVTAATLVGAFPLAATSKDSVLLVTLPPGNYSAQITGVGNTTGVGLVEVYELP